MKSFVHWILSIGLFSYLHLLKVRGCKCATQRPAFCRLYTATGLLVLWRTALLAMRAKDPNALATTADGRLNVPMFLMTAVMYLAFYAAFIWFAYDLWRDTPSCACLKADPVLSALGIGSVVYSVLMALTTFVLLTLFLFVIQTMPDITKRQMS